MNILVDVDGVVADTMTAWLDFYNHNYDDILTPEDITSWDMVNFVKPECGEKIYEFLTKDYLYEKTKPIDGASSGVKHLRGKGHRVIFATAGIYTTAKFHWLEEHGFEPGKNAEDYVSIYDKNLLRGDILIDDRDKNVESFVNRTAILFDQPWNKNITWSKRAFSWHDVIQMIREIVS